MSKPARVARSLSDNSNASRNICRRSRVIAPNCIAPRGRAGSARHLSDPHSEERLRLGSGQMMSAVGARYAKAEAPQHARWFMLQKRDCDGPTFFRSRSRRSRAGQLAPEPTKREARKRRASERPRAGCCGELGSPSGVRGCSAQFGCTCKAIFRMNLRTFWGGAYAVTRSAIRY
jgi:hypothetical protein